MTTVFITNIPAPYRERLHELVGLSVDNYHVIYCASIEQNRDWEFTLGDYQHQFLRLRTLLWNGRTIYLGSNVIAVLNDLKPSVVINGGFSLPGIQSFFWAKWHGKKFISFSDATTDSEQELTFAHRLVRKMIYGFSDAFIGASQKTLLLFKSYGATSNNSFQSCLCIDNSRFSACHKPQVERDYDIMLSGQFSARKMISFSAEVILEIHRRNPGIKILLIGDGPDRAYMVEKLSTNNVDFHYAGFVTQDALPEYYGNAKLLFFPSLNDPWGVVANEACAAGTPIMTVSGVGAANELVIHNENGLVLPLNAETWAKEALDILGDQLRWERMSTRASESVQCYNYTNASNGFIDAAHSVESS